MTADHLVGGAVSRRQAHRRTSMPLSRHARLRRCCSHACASPEGEKAWMMLHHPYRAPREQTDLAVCSRPLALSTAFKVEMGTWEGGRKNTSLGTAQLYLSGGSESASRGDGTAQQGARH